MRRAFCIFAIVSILFIALATGAAYPSTIIIGMNIDKQVYNVNDQVSITGNLTENGVIVNNSTVAIQVNTPAGTPFILRTLSTGVNSTRGFFKVVILDLRTEDQLGQNQTFFTIGGTVYIALTIKNIDTIPHQVLAAFTIQYADNSPFIAFYPFNISVQAGVQYEYITSMPIPAGAKAGQATIFASLFTDEPELGGVSYCLEKTGFFYIQAYTPLATPQPQYFNMTFKLPKTEAKLGNYTVYARAQYRLTLATNIQGFRVVLLGDLYPDGKIDMRDVGTICSLYGTKTGDARWNPLADLNGDGTVNMRDIGMEVANFGASGSY